MSLSLVSAVRCHGGEQQVWRHDSSATGTPMTFALFLPEHASGTKLPLLWWLSGLTCTHQNAMEKAEYRAACAQHGIAFVCPDTSPRGDGVPDDDAYDMGQGAGFYVDATQGPWAKNFHMRRYIEDELPALLAAHFPLDMARQGISGHSMGGHGALTIALRNPGRYLCVSAFAPIASPRSCPWGHKALANYLGPDQANWREYDACALIEDGARLPDLLVDQGTADDFLETQLKTHLLQAALAGAGMTATIRMQDGYDHSYFFISTFMADHVAWHAARLKASIGSPT